MFVRYAMVNIDLFDTIALQIDMLSKVYRIAGFQ